MEGIRDEKWLAGFHENPFVLKIVIVWLYSMSIYNFLVFCAVLSRFELSTLAPAFGYIYWELAHGVTNRDNISRIFTLVSLGLVAIFRADILWNGGSISLEALNVDLSASYPASVIILLINFFAMVILLHPQTGRLFIKSS